MAARTTAPKEEHDVVIVGAGLSGSILAKECAEAGLRVMVLEAGTDLARTFAGYQQQLQTFYDADAKTPEAPYEFNPNAPQPDIPGLNNAGANYFQEVGPDNFRSTYARAAGGTMLHWMGTCLRMLPEDFDFRTRFGRGRDWPIGYRDLARDYESAEWEIGVSGDVGDQRYLGVSFRRGYSYPMRRVPQSWSDKRMAAAVDGMTVELGGEPRQLFVRSTPAGRNSTPNGDYQPVGAVNLADDWRPVEEGQDLTRDIGERCQGNTACVPICPVQAKYNAVKTLAKGTATGNVRVLTQAVASRVLVGEDGRAGGIEYLRYETPDSPRHTRHVARGRVYVLACHAVENAKLMLHSGLPSSSGQVGRNLSDHPTLLAWGLTPERVVQYRGPISTSGIEDLRGGDFRRDHAAFRIEVGNDGWVWPTGAPATDTIEAVQRLNLTGSRLREWLRERVGRQFRIGALVEQLPEPGNRITVDPRYVDALGLPRPVIDYSVDDYVLAGMEAAAGVADQIFRRMGAQDHTDAQRSFAATSTYRGRLYPWDGAGHFAGTHLMGDDPSSSVVDGHQRSWDHRNLYLAGPGSMPSMGTSNPSLTVAALAFRTARNVVAELDGRRGRRS
jgi:choline dehydrogenase-like flavoprotein